MRLNRLRAAVACLISPILLSSAAGFSGEDVLKGNPWHHEDITRRALAGDDRYDGAGFSGAAADAIAWHADYIDSYLYNPLFWAQGVGTEISLDRIDAALAGYANLAKLHFDDTFTTTGIRANYERYASGTLAGLYWASLRGASGDLEAAQNILGVSFHAVQDFYSHTNWVDDPDRRCMTWLQTKPEKRDGMPLYAGAYETAASGAPKHHGAYSLSCSLLRGDTMDQVIDPICTGYSPFQNTSLCEEWRLCRGGAAVTMSVNDSPQEGIVFLNPPGIALDTTWLARVQAVNRGLVDQNGNFAPHKDGMYFRREECAEIVKATGHDVCEKDADQIFAGAKDLAIRATMEWAEYLEKAMQAMGPRQAAFWGRLKRSGSSKDAWPRQYEDFSRLPYQFLAAGPYPVANPSTPDREIAGEANGWYLRLRVKTSNISEAGTDSDVYARVHVNGGDQDILLDYLPTDDTHGRTNNRLLVYNDFEKGNDEVYMLGPFTEKPQSIALFNDSASGTDVFAAIWHDFSNSIEESLTTARRAIISLIAGNADYVGTASHYRTFAELDDKFADYATKISYRPLYPFFDDFLHVDGGDEGVHDVHYRVRVVEGYLTPQERQHGWRAMEVQLRKLHTIRESKVDRGSTSDEPFVIFHVAPLNGRADAAHTYLSKTLEDMDDGDEYVFPRRTGSAVIVKIPPEGGLVISAQVYESDSENEFDRQQLKRTFASGFDEESREEADKFGDELGRYIAADWTVDFIEAFAFERGAIPNAGPVLKHSPVGLLRGDETSRTFPLDWSKVRPLLAADNVVDTWEADPVKADVLEGVWHAQGYDCDGPVDYDSVDVKVMEASLEATKITGTPCVGAGELSWKGEYKDGVIEGELLKAPPPKEEDENAEEEATPRDTRPNYHDTSIDPMLGLEGNWMITWEDAENTPPGYAVLSKGPGYQCVDGPDGCWYQFTRDPDAAWSVGFWTPPSNSSGGSVTISPSGEISTSYNYFHLGYWGGASKGVAKGDKIIGEWSYGEDKKGREIWTRVRPKVTETETWIGETPERKPIGDPVTVTGPYSDASWYMRGNRPTVYLNLYGENMWGLHYFWLPRESDIEISGLNYICQMQNGEGYPLHSNYHVCMSQGGVLGVQLPLILWPNAKPGPHTLYFNDQEIVFNLNLTGFPEPPPEPVYGWRPMKLEMASCSTLQEVDPPEGETAHVFTRSDFRRW